MGIKALQECPLDVCMSTIFLAAQGIESREDDLHLRFRFKLCASPPRSSSCPQKLSKNQRPSSSRRLLSKCSTAAVRSPLYRLCIRSPATRLDAVCTFPPEYCEFGSSLTRCKEWLNESHPDLYPKYYSDGAFLRCSWCSVTCPSVPRDSSHDRSFASEALQAKVGTLSLEAQTKLEKETAKKEAKAEAKADAEKKKKLVRSLTPIASCAR